MIPSDVLCKPRVFIRLDKWGSYMMSCFSTHNDHTNKSAIDTNLVVLIHYIQTYYPIKVISLARLFHSILVSYLQQQYLKRDHEAPTKVFVCTQKDNPSYSLHNPLFDIYRSVRCGPGFRGTGVGFDDTWSSTGCCLCLCSVHQRQMFCYNSVWTMSLCR